MKSVSMLLMSLLVLASCTDETQADAASHMPAYNRNEWGRWIDADRDCQDTRQEVLIRSSLEPVKLDERGCKVLSGLWACPYTGQKFTDPGRLDIDHIVPLREAHVSGGYNWTLAEKARYFNDLRDGHLWAVSSSANRSKGARQPHQWIPQNYEFRCEYLRTWIKIKQIWGLNADCLESQFLNGLMIKHCESP